MTFIDAVTTCFKKYAAFDGTASRSEFWWFFLFQFGANFIISLISPKLGVAVSLGLFLPSIAVGCRRLHDTGRSGWLQLICLIPIIGWIVLVVFWAQDSKANRY